jgi:2-oxo-3-hexenedioate decarboxylase
MLHPSELRQVAARIRAAQAGVRQIEPFSSRYPAFDLESAYAVAQTVHADRVAEGAVPVGRKIGFTNAAMWELYGVREPIWGHVYDHTVRHLDQNAGTCGLGAFTEPRIEPEIAFHFHSPPPAGADARALLACIDWFAHAFEIVQSHFPGWRFRAADAVADGSLHGILLLGEAVPVERLGAEPEAALEAFSVELWCNGEVIECGRGANVLGSPLRALAHLVAVLSSQPESLPLQAGEIVTTGTITTARSVQPGERWHTSLDGIASPGLAVEFVA